MAENVEFTYSRSQKKKKKSREENKKTQIQGSSHRFWVANSDSVINSYKFKGVVECDFAFLTLVSV